LLRTGNTKHIPKRLRRSSVNTLLTYLLVPLHAERGITSVWD